MQDHIKHTEAYMIYGLRSTEHRAVFFPLPCFTVAQFNYPSPFLLQLIQRVSMAWLLALPCSFIKVPTASLFHITPQRASWSEGLFGVL